MRRERIQRDLGRLDRRERKLSQPQPHVRGGIDVLVARVGDDTDEEALELEVLDSLAGEREVPVVRWIERAAEDPDRTAHSQTRTSSPISTSEPGLTPAARSASSSSSPSGARPTTRNPWPVRSTLNRRRSGGFGLYSRNAGQLLRDGHRLVHDLRAEREEQGLQLVYPRAGRAGDAVDGHDPLILARRTAQAPGRDPTC